MSFKALIPLQTGDKKMTKEQMERARIASVTHSQKMILIDKINYLIDSLILLNKELNSCEIQEFIFLKEEERRELWKTVYALQQPPQIRR